MNKNKEFIVLSLRINNPTVEDFYKKECNSDEGKFIETIMYYIEAYTIKQSVKQGLEEAKLQSSGQLGKRELKHMLNEL